MLVFNDRRGDILLRASASDLEIIQPAIQLLDQNPPINEDADSIISRLRQLRDRKAH